MYRSERGGERKEGFTSDVMLKSKSKSKSKSRIDNGSMTHGLMALRDGGQR